MAHKVAWTPGRCTVLLRTMTEKKAFDLLVRKGPRYCWVTFDKDSNVFLPVENKSIIPSPCKTVIFSRHEEWGKLVMLLIYSSIGISYVLVCMRNLLGFRMSKCSAQLSPLPLAVSMFRVENTHRN